MAGGQMLRSGRAVDEIDLRALWRIDAPGLLAPLHAEMMRDLLGGANAS